MAKKGICTQCNKDFEYPYGHMGKFCSPQCRGLNRSLIRKQKFLLGEAGNMDRATIRKYIAEERGYKCVECGISSWNGKSITLQVNHKDGNASNHNFDNVELICPNCHSQTETFGSRNRGFGRKARGLSLR